MGQSGDYLEYLDSLIGKSGDTSHLDSLVGAADTAGYSAYLDQLLGTTPAAATNAPTQAKDLTNIDDVVAMAKQQGWADPTAFRVDNIESTPGGSNWNTETPTTYRMKDASGWKNNNGEHTVTANMKYTRPRAANFNDEVSTAEDYAQEFGNYSVVAGEVPGTKRYTRALYGYDKDGKFLGTSFDSDERWYEGAAPLIQLGLMAATMGGGGAALGGSINSSLGLGLGEVGVKALGGAALGTGKALLTGQNPIRGAVAGAAGAGVGALNPAGMMDFTNPVAIKAVNGAISGATGAAINGQNVLTSAVAGGAAGAIGGYDPAKQLGITNPTLHNVVNGAIQGGARGLITGQSPAELAVFGGLEGLVPPRKR